MKGKGKVLNELRNLLELSTKESLILFGNPNYNQMDGVTMGSPYTPISFYATMRKCGWVIVPYNLYRVLSTIC